MREARQPPLFPALQRPYIIAHQGGETLAPSNTLAAFAVADAIGGVDFMDIDVHMTSDGHLVGIHDASVDRTTNGSGRVDSYTLVDLQKLDAGYRFQDLRGAYCYRGKGVRVPVLEEFISAYAARYHLHFELKDAYPRAGRSQIEEKLWELIQRYNVQKRVIVSSFHQAVVRRFHALARGEVVIEAGRSEVTRFVLAHSLRLPLLYRGYSRALAIPLSGGGINLQKRSLVVRAQRLGMEVYYWTIDDAPTMRELIKLGADGLFTNRPDLLKEVVQRMRLR
jgi:glycerophosphoryl diester phosphodiesterase